MGENIVKLTVLFRSILIIAGLILLPGVVAAQNSLYQDYKASQVGDAITVVLAENISGQSNTTASTKSNSTGKASGSVTGTLTKFLPVFGAGASLDYNTADNISSVQNQLLKGTLTARVEKVGANGNLYIVGKRSTEINGEIHTLDLEGYVRPQDISPDNSVLSYRIANAHITYLKKGNVRHRPGFVRKTLFVVLGLALGVAAFKGAGG